VRGEWMTNRGSIGSSSLSSWLMVTTKWLMDKILEFWMVWHLHGWNIVRSFDGPCARGWTIKFVSIFHDELHWKCWIVKHINYKVEYWVGVNFTFFWYYRDIALVYRVGYGFVGVFENIVFLTSLRSICHARTFIPRCNYPNTNCSMPN